jgi:hypothetical protein
MAKFVNTRWSTRAAVALVIAIALAGCGKRDDIDGPGPVPGPGGPGDPVNNPTDTFAITSMNRLVSFSRTSPAIRNAVAITGLAATETIVGFDFRPSDGTIVLLTRLGSSAQLFRLNSSDGTTSLIGPLMADSADNSTPFTALDGTSFGVNFNPVPDRLRVVSDTGQNLRIDVSSGATITDAGLLNADGVRSATGITATAYTNSFASTCRTNLFYIDTTGNQLLTTADPNQGILTPVGPIAVDTGASVTGFEVLTTADSSNNDSPVNTALIVSTANGASTLMTLNLNTAAVTNAQSITGLNTGETVTAISMAPPNRTPRQPLGELVAVTQFNRLISFNRGAPQKLCTGPTNITGLQAGDNVLGIDVRPRDGLLYALGTSSTRLYTISTTPGSTFASATMGPVLQPAGGSSFNGLSGNDFGFDFNPMTDRLRVVSNTGQSLSIDVDMGLATSQSTLNPGLPGVTAAAYNGNVVNSSATTLYVIDTSNESLSTQGVPTTTPANGTLTRIGSLGTADITGSNGFDISGRDGFAVAAFTLASSPNSSDLFNINLGSGLATRINTIGGGERIRGLAFSNAPAPMLMAVTADNQLLTFDPAKPDTLVDNVSIDGLQGGETVTGLQVRADGKLQITSDGQRSYSLDAISGEATLLASAEIAKPRAAAGTTATGIRFNASVSNGTGLSFAANVSALGQSRLFKLDASGQATAVGMIGPSGTAPVRALAIRLN